MKVALLVPNFSDYSGDAVVVARQAEKFSKAGDTVDIFSLGGSSHSEHANILIIGMPENLTLQRIYRLFFPIDFMKITKWLPKFNEYDRIIAHLYPMTVFGYLAKKKYRVEYYFWFHGLEDPSVFSKFHEKIYMKLFIFLTKLSLKNVDQVYSVSGFAQKNLMDSMNIHSTVLYNEVDEHLFHKNIDGKKIRNELNLNDSPVFLSIGRLGPQKKFDLLLKVFTEIKRELPDAKLIIIGKSSFKEYYEELQKNSDESVVFIEFVPKLDMPNYYAACDIYVTCSYWETFCLPVVEAQLCGKPVITFDTACFKEVVNKHGKMVRKGEIGDFARACVDKFREIRGINENLYH